MTIRLVVSDTSPVRVLYHLSKLHLLGDFFDEVLIPPAVARELEAPKSRFAAIAVADIPKCRIQAPKDVVAIKALEMELQSGEAEAITLARELGTELLIDERAGRLVAERFGISCLGVIGLLVRAKQKGLIPEVVPLVLRARGEMNFFISDMVLEQLRRLVDE